MVSNDKVHDCEDSSITEIHDESIECERSDEDVDKTTNSPVATLPKVTKDDTTDTKLASLKASKDIQKKLNPSKTDIEVSNKSFKEDVKPSTDATYKTSPEAQQNVNRRLLLKKNPMKMPLVAGLSVKKKQKVDHRDHKNVSGEELRDAKDSVEKSEIKELCKSAPVESKILSVAESNFNIGDSASQLSESSPSDFSKYAECNSNTVATANAKPPTELNPSSSSSNNLKIRSDVTRGKKRRCQVCKKKLDLTAVMCRCGGIFCGLHRYDREHGCTFDYKALGYELLKKQNPRIVGEKIRKL